MNNTLVKVKLDTFYYLLEGLSHQFDIPVTIVIKYEPSKRDTEITIKWIARGQSYKSVETISQLQMINFSFEISDSIIQQFKNDITKSFEKGVGQ